MHTSYLSRSCPAPFYLLHPDTIHLLNKFIYNQIKIMPHPMRFNIINKRNRNNLQCFINLYQKNFLDKYEKAATNNGCDYTEVSLLYAVVILMPEALSRDCNSKENFNLSRMLIEGALDVSTDNIEKYLEGSPIKFHLFAFLYEIIVKQNKYSKRKREILNSLFCYSDKYEKLTTTEAAKKLGVTYQSVHMAKQSLERNIRDVIKAFRVFAPFYSYRSRYLSNAEITKISPDVFNSIRKEEREKGMTDRFIAKVLSVIYNYNLTIGETGGKADYLLVHRGSALNKIIRFNNPEAERN